MAKYEDYVKRHNEAIASQDELELEIDEAANRTEQRTQEDKVPERFKGKTREEIALAWEEADRALARQGNELGELRKTVTDLVEKTKVAAKPPREVVPVTMDDIYENADAAMRRVVREESTERIDDLERQVQEANSRASIAESRRRFEVKHPTYEDTLKDPEFLAWIKKSSIRSGLAALADQGNYDAADELFSTYGELKELKTTPVKAVRSEAARAVALERSGGVSPAPVETYSRNELQEKRISAQKGDRVAGRWLQAHGESIRTAYAEGRVSD